MNEAQEILDRALPFTEPWRSKQIKDMTPNERRLARIDAEEGERASRANFEAEDADYEDRGWAYEAMQRSRYRLKELKTFEARLIDESV